MSLWTLFWIVIVAFTLWDVLFVVIPYFRGNGALKRGRNEEATRLLAKAVATPSPLSALLQRDARYKLAYQRMRQGDYNAAIALLQTNLARKVGVAEETSYRARLAEALDGAGRSQEAEAERQRGQTLVANAPNDFQRSIAEGEAFNKQQRYEDAYRAFERGLEQLPRMLNAMRPQIMVQLGLAAFNAGRTSDALRWGEAALALPAEPLMQMLAHSVAMLALNNLGRLEEAEHHGLQGLEMASRVGDRERVAQTTAQLAEMQGRRGKLTEALQRCEQARALRSSDQRIVLAVEMECIKAQGRFAEAFALVEALQRHAPYPSPTEERRIQAAYRSELAALSAELNQPQAALDYNKQALDGLQNDAKLTAIYRANQAFYLGLAGRQEEARAEAQAVEALLTPFAEARGVQLAILAALGRAFLALGEPERSRAYWQRFEAWSPDPVQIPRLRYHLGECARLGGETEVAKAQYEQALATGLDTHYTHLAQQRLSEPHPNTAPS